MISRPQISLFIAGDDNRGTPPHAAQGRSCLQAEFPSLGGDQIGNLMRLKMSPHIFDWIEFGRIGWQPLHDNAIPGGGDVIFDQGTAMNGRPIPNDQQFPWQVPLEMAQKLNHLQTLDAAGVDLEVKPPKGQATNDGQAFPVKRLLEHWGLPARSPGARSRRTGAQAAFINKDDGSPLLPGLFFKAGKVTRFQWRIALSSRSIARRSGRWQLKPLAPSKRQTCPG